MKYIPSPKITEKFSPFNYKDQLEKNKAQIKKYLGTTPEEILNPRFQMNSRKIAYKTDSWRQERAREWSALHRVPSNEEMRDNTFQEEL